MTWLEDPRRVLTVAGIGVLLGFSIVGVSVVLLNAALG
jgi:hypothetical protein